MAQPGPPPKSIAALRARERRLLLLAQARESVWHALRRANLAEMDTEEARRQLSSLRLFFGDLLRLERLELGEGQAAAAAEEPPQLDEEIRAVLENVYAQG